MLSSQKRREQLLPHYENFYYSPPCPPVKMPQLTSLAWPWSACCAHWAGSWSCSERVSGGNGGPHPQGRSSSTSKCSPPSAWLPILSSFAHYTNGHVKSWVVGQKKFCSSSHLLIYLFLIFFFFFFKWQPLRARPKHFSNRYSSNEKDIYPIPVIQPSSWIEFKTGFLM